MKPGSAKDEAKDVGKEASQNSCDSSTLVDILARFNEITMIDSLQAQGAEFAKLIKVRKHFRLPLHADLIMKAWKVNLRS